MSHFLAKIKTYIEHRVQQIHINDNDITTNQIDFCKIFYQSTAPVIIAEIKFASPSLGVIYPGTLTPVQIAAQYKLHGANALSVLTEPTFFSGNIEFISQIRQNFIDYPILLKDFVLSPLQIKQAQLFGANAVLLIVSFLDPGLLQELYNYSTELGLTPLIEVHNFSELELALKLYPKLIGINNRNLHTLAIDLNTARSLIAAVPDNIFTICESGVNTLATINEMTALGFDGFLIGGHLMQHCNPGEKLTALLNDIPDDAR